MQLQNSVIFFASTALLASFSCAEAVAKQVYKFPNSTWLENLVVRTNGEAILTTISYNTIFTYKLGSTEPQAAIDIPNVAAVTGIAEISPDKFLIAGGDIDVATEIFSNHHFFVLDFDGCKPKITKTFPGPETGFPNGMAAVPSQPGVALVSDSFGGNIWRVDGEAGTFETVFQDPLFARDTSTNPAAFGVNGIRIFGGYMYYTITSNGMFGRVKVSEDGRSFGSLEAVAQLSDPAHTSFDDFAIDKHGVAYAAVHPNIVERIWPDGRQDVLVGGDSTLLTYTTSVAIAKNGRELIVTSAGFNGTAFGGGEIVLVEI